MMKRLCSLLLAAVLLCSAFSAYAADSTVKATAISVEQSVYTYNLTDYNSHYQSVKVTLTFPKKSNPDNFEEVKVASSNKAVAEVYDTGWQQGARKMTFDIDLHGLGVAKLTFKTKSGLKATCKILVKDLYFLGIKGITYTYKNLPSAKINGKLYYSWKAKNKNYIKAAKTTFKCLKTGKSTLLYKKVDGRTYRIHVLATTKKELLEMITPTAKTVNDKHRTLVGEPQVYLKKSDNLYMTSVTYYYKSDVYTKGYGYYLCSWRSGELYHSPDGLQYIIPVGDGWPVKKSEVGKPFKQFGG